MSSFEASVPIQAIGTFVFLVDFACKRLFCLLSHRIFLRRVECQHFHRSLCIDDVDRLARRAFDLKFKCALRHKFIHVDDFAQFVRAFWTAHPKRVAILSNHCVATLCVLPLGCGNIFGLQIAFGFDSLCLFRQRLKTALTWHKSCPSLLRLFIRRPQLVKKMRRVTSFAIRL